MSNSQAGSPAGPAPAVDRWDALRVWANEQAPDGSASDASWVVARSRQVDPELLRRWARQYTRKNHPDWDKNWTGYAEANWVLTFVDWLARDPYLAVFAGPAVQMAWSPRWAQGQIGRLVVLNREISRMFGVRTEPDVLARALGEAVAAAMADPVQTDREAIAITVIVGLLLGQANEGLPAGDILRWLTVLPATRTGNLGVLHLATDLISGWARAAGPKGWAWAAAGYTQEETAVLLALPEDHPDRPGPDQLVVMAALREPDGCPERWF